MSEKAFDNITCSKCQVVKSRLKTGHKYRNKTWRYLDENGHKWEGRICPSCLKAKNDKRNELVRLSKDGSSGM
jgi:hypothetical protein